MRPAISVVITTFNRAPMLERAMRSVFNQTFTDFELLVLDNSSSDQTPRVIASFSDRRLRYLKHEPLGISAARNLALREARADLIAFLDDDDEFLPEKLRLQYEIMENDRDGKIGLVYGAYIHCHQESGRVYETIVPHRRGDVYVHAISYRDTLTGSASNPLLRRNAVQAVGGYDESVFTGEDYEMFLRLSQRFHFDYVSEPVVVIYVHRGYRLGNRLADYLNTELTVYRKHQSFIDAHRRVRSRHLQVIGGKYIRLGQTLEGRHCLRQAIRANFFSGRAWAQLGLSFLPLGVYRRAHQWARAGHYWRQRWENKLLSREKSPL